MQKAPNVQWLQVIKAFISLLISIIKWLKSQRLQWLKNTLCDLKFNYKIAEVRYFFFIGGGGTGPNRLNQKEWKMVEKSNHTDQYLMLE